MNRIKELRELMGLKQSDFVLQLNVTQATLSNWERGVHDPDNESLKKMVEFFGTTSDYILGLSDDPRPPDKKNSLSPEKIKLLDGIGYAYYGGEDKELDEEDVDHILDIVRLGRELREKSNRDKDKK